MPNSVNSYQLDADDPGQFDEERAPVFVYQEVVEMDRLFQEKMLWAREKGFEHFSLGIDHRPGTLHPRFVKAPHHLRSFSGSPAARCTEGADREEEQQSFPTMG